MDKLADESHSVSGDVDVDISYIAGSLKKTNIIHIYTYGGFLK